MNRLKRINAGRTKISKGIKLKVFGTFFAAIDLKWPAAALLLFVSTIPSAAQQATFNDNFYTDTTGNYPVFYNSNSNSVLYYDFPNNAACIRTTGWNGSHWRTSVKISSGATVRKTDFKFGNLNSTNLVFFRNYSGHLAIS